MNRRHLRTSLMLVVVLSLTGAIENIISIAQTTEQVQINTELRNEILVASIDKDIKVTEKVVDEWYIPDIKLSYDEQKFLHSLCEKFDVPYNLMLAQIRCESNFDNSLIGSCGDTGYFQILPSWDDYLEQEFNRKINIKDNYDNLESGTFLMYNNLLSAKKYKDDKEKYTRALNAFNQGGQSSLNYAKRNGWNSWHYGNRVYKCFQEYEKGDYKYDPYE